MSPPEEKGETTGESVALRLVPVFQRQVKQFIGRYHRHNLPSLGAVFVIGLADADGELVGVAMAGVPKARLLMDGTTLEVTRVCVIDGHRNANSMLYGACARAAAALGYKRLVTYTLPDEGGASLKASGWRRDEVLREHDIERWRSNGGHGAVDLFGEARMPSGPKVRWWKCL